EPHPPPGSVDEPWRWSRLHSACPGKPRFAPSGRCRWHTKPIITQDYSLSIIIITRSHTGASEWAREQLPAGSLRQTTAGHGECSLAVGGLLSTAKLVISGLLGRRARQCARSATGPGRSKNGP